MLNLPRNIRSYIWQLKIEAEKVTKYEYSYFTAKIKNVWKCQNTFVISA